VPRAIHGGAGVGDTRVTAYLVDQNGRDGGSRHDLVAATTTLGRDPQNAIVLTSKGSSRRHAAVVWDGQQYVLQDLGSRNGTYLNGARLAAPHSLRDGDVLLLGGQRLVFETDETTDWTPAQADEDGLRLDLASASVWVGGRQIQLTAQEYRTLLLLHRERAALVTKEALAQHLWPEAQGAVADETLMQIISRLRRKLGDDADNPRFLHTVRGLGYRLAAAEPPRALESG